MRISDATTRFSKRVANYTASRPGYPSSVYSFLQKECALNDGTAILDVGSGTGLLTRLFLERGHSAMGVEPNADMRRAAEGYLKKYSGFTSLDGRAEALPVVDASVDLILAGQAFHWFDPHEFRSESLRVGKAGAWSALIWNNWQPEMSPFLAGYDNLLREFGTDYARVSRRHARVGEGIKTYFGKAPFQVQDFPHFQTFDFEGLQGRLLSSSYVPLASDANFKPMITELKQLFALNSEEGLLKFDYVTRVYLGQLSAANKERIK